MTTWTKAGQFGPDAVVTGTPGRPATLAPAGTEFTLLLPDKVTKAALFTDEDMTGAAPNPFALDAAGNISLYAEPGSYWLSWVVAGVTTTVQVVIRPHPDDLARGASSVQTVAGVAPDPAGDVALTAADVGADAAGAAAAALTSAEVYADDGHLETAAHSSATYVASEDGSSFTWNGQPVSLGGAGLPAHVVTKTANYTASAGDLVQADATAGSFTVTLPAAPATGSLVTVKRTDASANAVTVAPSGTGSIDGDPTATIVSQWAGAIFEHVGADAWRITGVLSYASGSAVADATTTTKGIIQLAGDLAGTAAAPTVPGLAGKLALAGGTMTGALVLAGDPTTDLQAATRRYVLAQANISYVYNAPLPSGDTTGATDTAAIQAKIDAAYAAGGGTVQLAGAPDTNPYYVTQLKIRKGVELVGVSRSGTVLRAPLGSTTHMIVLYDKTETWGWAIRLLTLDGQNGDGPDFGSTWSGQANTFDGIHIDNHLGTQHFPPYNADMIAVIQDIMITQMPGHGLSVSDTTSECRFVDVYSRSNRDCGFYITGFDLIFSNCTAGRSGNIGFCLNSADVNQFENCKAFWNGQRGSYSNLGSANYWIKGQGNLFTGCFSQDSFNSGWSLVSAHENRITGESAGAGSASPDLALNASNNNHIDLAIGHGQNNTPAQHVLNHSAASTGNVITITGDSNCTGNKLTGLSMIGNELTMLQQRASQSVAYAATITPDPYKGARVIVGTLTGALTVADPANAHHGCVFTLTLPQDATGGRAVTFGASYKTSAAIPTTASSVTIISFVYDGTNWRETARSTT